MVFEMWNNVKNNGNSEVFNQQQAQQLQQQHPMSNVYGQQNGHLHYDPSQTQSMQTHTVLANGFVGSEDYTHYPYPDEYLNDRNCQYLIAAQTGDPYTTSVSKSQSHNGIDPECK